MKRFLTDENHNYIKAQCLVKSSREIAIVLGVSRGAVRGYLRTQKILIPKEIADEFKRKAMMGKTSSTPEIDKMLKKYYLKYDFAELAFKAGKSKCFVRIRLRQLGLIVPPEMIEARRSRFKKGDTPVNKGKKWDEYMSPEAMEKSKTTHFKKGNYSCRWKGFKDGDMRMREEKRSGIVYKYVRLAAGKWYPLHRVIWEQEYGKPPKGNMVTFKDGNQMNCELDNLELITMAENYIRNSASVNMTDGFIIHAIAGGPNVGNTKALREELKKYPELIDIKRMELQLKRTIKKRINETE